MPSQLLSRLLLGLITVFGLNVSATAQSYLEAEFDPAIPTLTEVVGHAPGERITSPGEMLAYLQALEKAAPERMRMVEYARSWEGRPLHYLILTSAENMARLDAIQADLASVAAGRASNGAALPVTWLASSVHGNELSPTDAALMTAYHLLAAQNDARTEQILSETIVILDPLQNPDGRAHFVDNYRRALGIKPIADRQAAEHDEPWPGGRVNHYMFDLNRDWFTLSQPETRGKVTAMLSWSPVVVADIHEMSGDDTYFFSPAAKPVNPNITDGQLRLYELIGRNNAAWFDRINEPYFTREIFDLFYPGYGDTWNAHQGAIGSTYEQGSPRGLVWERPDGSLLTYADAVRNQFIASIGTVEAVAQNADRFLQEFANYRSANANGAAGRGTYVIDLSKQRWNAEALGRRLTAQGISVVRRAGPAMACGTSYPNGYLAVSQAQPAARLVRSLLDIDTPLPRDFIEDQEARRSDDLPHELYDVTAWSVGIMSGTSVALCPGSVPGTALASTDPIAPIVEGDGAFATAVPWTDAGQARLVALALGEGLSARVTDEAFVQSGREFPMGTVVFPAGANDPEQMARLAVLAQNEGAHIVRLNSSWVEEGPNLGSDAFASLTLPKVAMAWGRGVSPLSAGATRFVLEQRLGVPVTPIRSFRITGVDLTDYDVLIIPDGNPSGVIGQGGARTIRSFVERGGVVVALGNSVSMLAAGKNPLLSVKREAALGRTPDAGGGSEETPPLAEAQEFTTEEEYKSAIENQNALPDILPGALLKTVADQEHYLSAGYADGAVVLASGSRIFSPLDRSKGINVLRFAAADNLIASGYVWKENQRQLAFKPYLMAQPTGAGLSIGFAHDPTTRGYLDGLDLLLANAVLIAPSRER